MSAFKDREDAFENRFVADEAFRFRALARRNAALGAWGAELQGLQGAAAENFVAAFVADSVGVEDSVVAKRLRALAKADISDHRIQRQMEQALAEALAARL